jgi:acetyl-CoA carboxylase biotin carboxyl carrier protein
MMPSEIKEGDIMNIKKIQELIELMNKNDLAEVEVELEGMKVKIVKGGHAPVGQVVYHSAPAALAAAPREGAAEATSAESGKNLKEVKSPMVGTFYRASAPDAEPYVQVGSMVQKGDVLCIVEAMKLMNEIKAEFGGKVAEILVENAESVQFGQTLFRIEPL